MSFLTNPGPDYLTQRPGADGQHEAGVLSGDALGPPGDRGRRLPSCPPGADAAGGAGPAQHRPAHTSPYSHQPAH
jgi:hypothetical protein